MNTDNTDERAKSKNSELEHYANELKELRNAVDKCDSSKALDRLEFFLRESNILTTGISTDVENEIYKEIKKFKKDCRCERRYP